MDSPQSVVSPFKKLSVAAEPEKQNSDVFVRKSGCLSEEIDVRREEVATTNLEEEDCIGVLEVHVHQARDIHNICIYHKQDVYAKLCLTSDSHNTVSTQTVNGGGQSPVFNESLRLKVRSIECSLKCEVWMLSRVKNYLEDQLLGFALIPLSEVIIMNGKLEKEYSLSSTDLFHSHAGFVQLSLSYSGACPEVMTIPKLPTSTVGGDSVIQESGVTETSDFDRIEFPDPNILNENQKMVSEYFGLPCSNLDTQASESSVSLGNGNDGGSKSGAQVVDSFSDNTVEPVPLQKNDSPLSSVSTNVPPVSLRATSQSSETSAVAAKSPNSKDHVSHLKEKEETDIADGESGSSNGSPNNHREKPIVSVNAEQDEKVVQQDIVDIYMKSMQQFTDSLAKMKLPMDLQAEPTKSGDSNSSSDQTKLQTPKSANSRVFYGSRAFF